MSIREKKSSFQLDKILNGGMKIFYSIFWFSIFVYSLLRQWESMQWCYALLVIVFVGCCHLDYSLFSTRFLNTIFSYCFLELFVFSSV
jgi:hypothetical protein